MQVTFGSTANQFHSISLYLLMHLPLGIVSSCQYSLYPSKCFNISIRIHCNLYSMENNLSSSNLSPNLYVQLQNNVGKCFLQPLERMYLLPVAWMTGRIVCQQLRGCRHLLCVGTLLTPTFSACRVFGLGTILWNGTQPLSVRASAFHSVHVSDLWENSNQR